MIQIDLPNVDMLIEPKFYIGDIVYHITDVESKRYKILDFNFNYRGAVIKYLISISFTQGSIWVDEEELSKEKAVI